MSACPVCAFSHLFYNNTSADWLMALLNNFNVLALDHKGKQWRELHKWLPSPPLRTASLPVRFWFLMGTTLALLWNITFLLLYDIFLCILFTSAVWYWPNPYLLGVGCFSFCFLVYAKPFDKAIAWLMEGLVLEPFLDKKPLVVWKVGVVELSPAQREAWNCFPL